MMQMLWVISEPLLQVMQSTPTGEVREVPSCTPDAPLSNVQSSSCALLSIIIPPIIHTTSSATEFDLDGYRATLDETGLKVADNQGASLENKRALAEKTKGGGAWGGDVWGGDVTW